MPIIQGTYGQIRPIGYPGHVPDGEVSNRISRTVEDSDGLVFGRAAFRGTGDHGVTKVPAAGAFMGVAIANVAQQPTQGVVPGGFPADTYPTFSTAALLNEGPIRVIAGSATTDGAAVYVAADGTFTAASAGNTPIPAAFDETVAPGALVRLRVRKI
ncbi:hypothetical protein [Methylobacterium sp. WL8]|uniref:structural cement protein Gp24 n=1 Tax=Methylobacterium sp. WL8 TaxID=2603899 RepID=UPI0011CA4B0D|nr:hypothetical protein [Methylobacterium sp. WL8]TXN76681.1 hypothetical protein FV234_24440 [Methylobacterium sp. WL8]